MSSFMPAHLGGTEQIAENLFQGYARHGIDTRWVASDIPASGPRHDGGRVRVPCFNGIERWLGVPVPIWGQTGWRELAGLVAWADALHLVECLYAGSGMAAALARRRGKPFVVSQNIGFVEYRSPALNAIEHLAYRSLGRYVLRSASHLVLATPSAEQFIPALLGADMPPASVFPVGIDTERFRPGGPADRRAARSALGLVLDRPLVLFAGRLVEKKGIPVLVEVARLLPACAFVAVGDGPLAAMVQSAPPNLTWHRAIAPAAMPAYYRAADCLLLPSRGEGLPLVVQEAMASGVPCIVSADEPYAGALVGAGACRAAPREPAALARAVADVLSDADGRMGRLARDHAVAHWSIDAMVVRHIALYRQLLSPAPAGGRPEAIP